ncbi:MAG: hypothetical protein JWM10_740 [Myxococcaceae bacterium]|nr:hypothetical protein [Myxococcaceae bacterium]
MHLGSRLATGLAVLAVTGTTRGDPLGLSTRIDPLLLRGTETSEHREVGLVRIGYPGARVISACTGTLLQRPDLVITAAHCLDYCRDGALAASFEVQSEDGRPRVFHIQQVWCAHSRPGTSDVALAQLAEPVPAELARPAPIATRAPRDEANVTAFGYGQTSHDGRSTGRRRFDMPFFARSQPNLLAHGDSGGPLLDAGGAVVAVVSGTTVPDGRGVWAPLTSLRPAMDRALRTWFAETVPSEPAPPVPASPPVVSRRPADPAPPPYEDDGVDDSGADEECEEECLED